MLELRDLHAAHGNIEVLHGIDMVVGENEIVTIIGANGAGKSSTLMAISGMINITGGQVLFNGGEISGTAAYLIAQAGICHVPEGRRIMPDMSLIDNLMLGAHLRRDRASIKRDLDRCFSLFPILAERRGQLGGTLSGGEQQMLAIGRALMQKPRLLMLDEPSLGLAPMIVDTVLQAITQISTEGKVPVLLVEQNASLALQMADRGYVLENGSVRLSAQCEKLMDNPQIKSAYLGI